MGFASILQTVDPGIDPKVLINTHLINKKP